MSKGNYFFYLPCVYCGPTLHHLHDLVFSMIHLLVLDIGKTYRICYTLECFPI